MAPSGTEGSPLILEFVHFVNVICVIAFIETTFIAKYVTSSMLIDIPQFLVNLSRIVDWSVSNLSFMVLILYSVYAEKTSLAQRKTQKERTFTIRTSTR